jgi:hypothetical protein
MGSRPMAANFILVTLLKNWPQVPLEEVYVAFPPMPFSAHLRIADDAGGATVNSTLFPE